MIRLLYWPAAEVIGTLCDASCPNPYDDVTDNRTASSTFLISEFITKIPVCSASRSVVMPSIPGPVTAVVDGYTLTSPTVYYSFSAISVTTLNGFGAPPGPTLTNQLIPINSADVSTLVLNELFRPSAPSGPSALENAPGEFYPIDWSNLNAPLPLMAYNQGAQCEDLGCYTIYEADYAPGLVMPPQLMDLHPTWSSCKIFSLGIYDPPHALQGTGAPAAPINTFTGAKTAPTPTARPVPGSAAPAVPLTKTTDSRPTQHPVIPASDPANYPPSGKPGSDTPSSDPGADPPRGASENPRPGSIASNPESSDSNPGSGEPSIPEQGSGDASLGGDHGSDPGFSADTFPNEPSDQGVYPSSGSNPKNSDQGASGEVVSIPADGAKAGSGPGSGGNKDPNLEAPGRSPGDVIASVIYGAGSADGVRFAQNPEAGSGLNSPPSRASDSQAFAFAGTEPIFVDPAKKDAIIVAGQTLNPGDPPITVDTIPVSVDLDGRLHVGASTLAIPAAAAQSGGQGVVEGDIPSGIRGSATTGAVFTLGSQTFTAVRSGGTVFIAGKALQVGGAPLRVFGKTVGADANGLVIADGTRTQTIPWSVVETSAATMVADFQAIDGALITGSLVPNHVGEWAVDGHTLFVGGPAIVLDRETVSAAPQGLVVVDSSRTTTIKPSVTSAPTVMQEIVFTGANGILVTAYEEAGASRIVIVDGKSLSVGGPAITMNGESISDGPAGLVVGYGTTTRTWTFTTATNTEISARPAAPESSGGLAPSGPAADTSVGGHAREMDLMLGLALVIFVVAISTVL